MKRVLLFGVGLLVASALGLGAHVAGQGKKAVDDSAKHDPAVAVENLDVHPDLKATLFASEPMITNPTNLDVDHRGRVWICDVKNYRNNNGKRPEGDRILILEDTDGDGKADKVTTFYQGRDIDSAMGVCVLGDKVIVSATPNIWVFTKDENDKILKKEALFTKSGQVQHDHSLHSFFFGPDGKYYWNFGNTGNALNDKNGNPVVDVLGNTVNAGGNPYRQGMAFRCDPDGSNFEVLGHNFRNNYELTVDSFGTVWQSDNDDDGNKAVRINYVMEGGNFGYADEFNGAGWQAKRTNLETEIPLRHWHLNDPGVVPNLLQTGAGSPTGICVYEGALLPKVFHNQIIHCEPGHNVVRSYPVTKSGAGYKAEIVNILDGSKRNNWFRPADVCVAADGSLFVTDWYDPGVGGHQQRDLDRGRIFRVAPAGSKYVVPKVNLTTLDGAIEALKSPNADTRYVAWMKLNQAGAEAEAALLKLAKSPIAHERARALWLMGLIKGKAAAAADLALADSDANVRIAGLRMAREWKVDVMPLVEKLAADADKGVLRECVLSLRGNKDPKAAELWARLALLHDGVDRWYLEALGIGAQNNWDACLAAYEAKSTSADAKAQRDIVWRSRAAKSPLLLADLIASKSTPTEELPRLFRALDFQVATPEKDAAIAKLAFKAVEGDPARASFIASESLNRLKNFDLKAHPETMKTLNDLLDRNKGTAAFVEMVAKFNVPNRDAELLAMAQKAPNDQVGVDAMRVLIDRSLPVVKTGIEAKDPALATNTLQAIANAANPKANDVLLALVKDAKGDLEVRRLAARALARNKPGAVSLVNLQVDKKLPQDIHAAASSVLHQAPWKDVKSYADKLFPLPAAKDNLAIPAIGDLVKLKGDTLKGKELFFKVGTCANCHVVNGEGKEVGPNLSEIGKKLAKEAMYESILYPSASISHNFDTWVIETKKGEVVQGVLVSQTPTEILVKEATSLTRKLARADVESLARSPVSLMPADLTKNLTSQDLADVVEYMQSLKESRK
ncbi:MAG: PVC-type heme-binding CxxCH protein [Planctomycetota bacterium]